MANETDAELLELARTALANRLRGDAYTEYGVADRRFRGASISELRQLIKDLQRAVAGGARLIKPISA